MGLKICGYFTFFTSFWGSVVFFPVKNGYYRETVYFYTRRVKIDTSIVFFRDKHDDIQDCQKKNVACG